MLCFIHKLVRHQIVKPFFSTTEHQILLMYLFHTFSTIITIIWLYIEVGVHKNPVLRGCFCSHLQQEQEKKRSEVEDLMGKIASLQAQNKKLLLQKNNFLADKTTLEAEMEMTQKTNRFLFFSFCITFSFSHYLHF